MTVRPRALAVLMALAMAPAPALALQEVGTLPGDRVTDANRITIGQTVSLPSDVYGGDRQVLVYLSDDYSRTTAGYPVLYLLDGAFFFLPTAGLVDFYSTIDRMPRMIVVAVVHANRMQELSTSASGGSAQLTSFLRGDLIPYMDGHFRTEPFRILIGHSLGGLFSVHSLVETPDLFQAHIAASPSLYWDRGSELDRAREMLTTTPSLKSFLHLTYSGGDGENIRRSTDELVGLLEASAPSGLDWAFQFLPDDRHNSSPVRSVLGGLSRLFSDWTYLGDDRAEAIRVFEYNARIHPQAPETHEALGSAYRRSGDTPRAIAAYERALELRPGNEGISEILRESRGGGG